MLPRGDGGQPSRATGLFGTDGEHGVSRRFDLAIGEAAANVSIADVALTTF